MTEIIEMHCPICRGKVKKVLDVNAIERDNIKCENEFYIHWRDLLYKITEPNTYWSRKDGKEQ